MMKMTIDLECEDSTIHPKVDAPVDNDSGYSFVGVVFTAEQLRMMADAIDILRARENIS